MEANILMFVNGFTAGSVSFAALWFFWGRNSFLRGYDKHLAGGGKSYTEEEDGHPEQSEP
jgi:hypothetical protein